MEEAAELGNYPPAFLQDAGGAGTGGMSVGRLHIKLREPEIPVRLSRLPHAHEELHLFQYLAVQTEQAQILRERTHWFQRRHREEFPCSEFALCLQHRERVQYPAVVKQHKAGAFPLKVVL